MRLKRLRIGKFKNLKDIEITFAHPYTVLVGQNGSGKSNIYEALVAIFDSLEYRRIAPFKYELEYDCQSWTVRIDSDPDRPEKKAYYYIQAPGVPDTDKPLPPSRFHSLIRDPANGLLPELVFGYYSGSCDRLRKPFDKYRRIYTRKLRRLDQEQVPSRRFLFGSLRYADLILVALWAHQLRDGSRSTVLDSLGVSAIADVALSLQPPPGYNPQKHDPRSMGLQGLTREFVGHFDLFAPADRKPGEARGSQFRISDGELVSLSNFASKRGTNLFNVLLQAQEEGVLAALNCTVVLKDGQGIPSSDFSEGEKQFLLVMGMLRFAEHADALFLLDEPDTHLNPRWSLDYITTITKELGHKPKSHIILATHDPLVLTELDAEEVQILGRDEKTGRVTITPCPYPPKEMGVEGLLTSPLFGLRAPIGSNVQKLINERAILLAKGEKATSQETGRVRQITQTLDGMGFAKVFADPIYNQFVAAMGKRPEFMKPVLTPAEMAEQESFAEGILDQIMTQDSMGPMVQAAKAVATNRELVRKDRAAHVASLARSLIDMASKLNTAGRGIEAQACKDEAATLFNELMREDREPFLMDMAGLLSEMAEDLSVAGNRRGALDCAVKAVALYRELAAKRPELFPSNVSSALGLLSRGLDAARVSGEFDEGSQHALSALHDLAGRREEPSQ